MSFKVLRQTPLNLQGKATGEEMVVFGVGTRKQPDTSKQPGAVISPEAEAEGLLGIQVQSVTW